MSAIHSAPHVTILLCTRNGMPWLAEQLHSLLEQQHDNWSLWISDDGSSDGTLEYLVDFAAQHSSRVDRILSGPGLGSAANFLSLLCHPELPQGITALCDQDDVWLPEKLAVAVKAIRALDHKSVVWAGRYLYCDENLQNQTASALWPLPPSFCNAILQNILSGHTITLNSLALKTVRDAGQKNVPHHDWWIYQLMTGTGAIIIQEEAPVLLYRQHSCNTVGIRTGLRARAQRMSWLFDGTYHRWCSNHLAALASVSKLLTPQAAAILTQWIEARGRWGKLRKMCQLRLTRQARGENLLLMVAVLFGRL